MEGTTKSQGPTGASTRNGGFCSSREENPGQHRRSVGGVGFRTAQERWFYRAIAEIQDSPLSSAEAVQRLAVDPSDARALIAIYEHHRVDFQEAAMRWFGWNRELRKRALNEILVAVARRAKTFDPVCEVIGDWIRKCADAEAQTVHKAFDRRSKGTMCERRC
jgi:hypothetical protein